MGINSQAEAVVRYGVGIVEWVKEELANLNRKMQKDNVDEWGDSYKE